MSAAPAIIGRHEHIGIRKRTFRDKRRFALNAPKTPDPTPIDRIALRMNFPFSKIFLTSVWGLPQHGVPHKQRRFSLPMHFGESSRFHE
jgi:hypothetical protein